MSIKSKYISNEKTLRNQISEALMRDLLTNLLYRGNCGIF